MYTKKNGLVGVGVRMLILEADVSEACVYVGPVIIKMRVCNSEFL